MFKCLDTEKSWKFGWAAEWELLFKFCQNIYLLKIFIVSNLILFGTRSVVVLKLCVVLLWCVCRCCSVCRSLAPLFDNPKLDKDLCTMLRENFAEFCSTAGLQANHSGMAGHCLYCQNHTSCIQYYSFNMQGHWTFNFICRAIIDQINGITG